MDYSGWELERQRRALAALLLGGGTLEDEEAVRREARQYPEIIPEGSKTAWETIAGTGRRSGGRTGGFQSTAAGAWETAWAAGGKRLDSPAGPKTPVRAWEGVLMAGTGFPSAGEADGPSGFAGAGYGTKEVFRVRAGEESRPIAVRPGRPGTAWAAGQSRGFLTEEAPVFPGFSSGEGGGGIRRLSATGSGREEAVGTPDGEEPEVLAVRRGGGSAGNPVRASLPVVQILEEAGGTRGGGAGNVLFQAEEDAKALSLAVQRDARRYDGGFTIY